MRNAKCEWCGEPLTPYQSTQRFCCRECNDAWFTEERRQANQILPRERAHGGAPCMSNRDTYFSRAIAEAEPSSGRFANIDRSTVTAAGGPRYPELPTSSPWHSDPVPPEVPLGFDINEVPAVGEPVASDDPPGAKPADDVPL